METITREEYEAMASEIRACEILLQNTDYIAMKLAEGATTSSEYKDEIAKRQTWRDTIHNLRDKLENSSVNDEEDQ